MTISSPDLGPTDLIISCGDSDFLVHKYKVCPKSRFFALACRINRRGSRSVDPIALDDEFDPADVERMIHFFYTGTYNYTDTILPLDPPLHAPKTINSHSHALRTHIALFALGTRYSVPALQHLAAQRFVVLAKSARGYSGLAEVLGSVYEGGGWADGLRGVVREVMGGRVGVVVEVGGLKGVGLL